MKEARPRRCGMALDRIPFPQKPLAKSVRVPIALCRKYTVSQVHCVAISRMPPINRETLLRRINNRTPHAYG